MSDSPAFLAAAVAIDRNGTPALLELVRDDGYHTILEYPVEPSSQGSNEEPATEHYELGGSYARAHVAQQWALLTSDWSTANELSQGRL